MHMISVKPSHLLSTSFYMMAEVVIHVFDVIINISDSGSGRFYIGSIINGVSTYMYA